MADDQEQTEQQAEDDSTDTDTGGQSGQGGTTAGRTQFTGEQQEYVNKLLADERRKAERKFQNSDEYKTLQAQAKQGADADQLRAENAKLRADKTGAVAKAEGVLIRAQFTAIAMQRGIPSERIEDALLLADKSGVTVDFDKGAVLGVEDAVQTLVESRPWLVGSGIAPQTTEQRRPAPNLNGGVQSSPVTDEARIAAVQQEMAARGLGRV